MKYSLTRGERFQEARRIHNVNGKETQAEVYAATGVPASKIKDLEDDDKERGVDYREIAKLAKHYGVTTDYLLGLSDEPKAKAKAADQLGISASAVESIARNQELWGDILSDILTAQNFMGLLASFHRLRQDVQSIKTASARGWKQNIEDHDALRRIEEELEELLGYQITIQEPRHSAILELSCLNAIVENLAREVSGYDTLTYAEKWDSSFEADPDELKEYLDSRYPIAREAEDGEHQED